MGVLKAEDLYDKQIEREKIRIRKKEVEEEEKESEESEIENDSSDDGPELDWLPDPDKVYGKEDVRIDDRNSSSDESVHTEGNERTKRKWKPPKKEKEKHKTKKAKLDKGYIDNNSNMDLMNTEDLALQLLRR